MYPYMAPKLIEGIANESPQTDMYSTGSIILSIYDSKVWTHYNQVLPTY